MPSRRWKIVLLSIVTTIAANAEIATFDDLPEGLQPGTSMTSGGITFTNGTWFTGGIPIQFGIDAVAAGFNGLGFAGLFSPPNVMTVGGSATEENATFWRVNGWEATAGGQLFTHGSVEVFHIDDFMGATGTLEALLGDAVVASDSFTILHDDPFHALHQHLEVDAPAFDGLRFAVRGGRENDGMLADFDDVTMTPQPGTAIGLLLGLAAIRRRAA